MAWPPASRSGSGMREKLCCAPGAVAALLCLRLPLSCVKSCFSEMETNNDPVHCTLLCVSFHLAVVSGCVAAPRL